MLLPSAFEQRERALLGARFAEYFAWTAPAPARGVTFNTLRGSAPALASASGLALAPSPLCRQAYRLLDEAERPGRHPYHHAGAFYVQEPSAAAPAALLDVRPGQRVADLCAAPGGKSSQLAAALRGQGLLLANEYEADRSVVLCRNLERMGAANAVVTNSDTAALAAALPGYFDCVLVDAPCSGEGMLRKEPAAAAQYSPALVEHCAALAREILEDAAALLAPGGILVFSTCTFAPQEDEAQIAAFLLRHPEFALCDLSGVAFGRSGEENRAAMAESCPPALAAAVAARCRRVWPADGGEGHFMAKLQKDAAAPAAVPPRAARLPRPGRVPPEWAAFARQYFPALADRPVRLQGERLTLPAPAMPPLPPAVRVLQNGVTLGHLQNGRRQVLFTPAHALFMAYGAQCASREALTLDDPRTAAWLRGEEIPAMAAAPGWCAVLADGLPLGAGKISGGRVKNHYPKGLRNLQ